MNTMLTTLTLTGKACRRGFFMAIALLSAAIACETANAQDLNRKAPPQNEPIVIENAIVHTITGDTIENGYVYFKGGLIEGVGKAPLPRFAEQVRIIDGTGKHVYPGLIAPYSQIGLTEIAAVRATLDMGEVGSGTPEVRAAVAVNPDSNILPVTRSNGVLIAGVFPRTDLSGQLAYFSGPGGLFPGRGSVMRLEGWTWEDMTIRDDVGLVINWPFPRVIDAWWMNKSREDQQKELDRTLQTIEGLLTASRAYAAGPSEQPKDIRYEAMRSIQPGFTGPGGQRPVFIEANDYDAIQQSVAMCVRLKLRCVIVGGRDAPMCADLLNRHHVAVIVEGTHRFPRRDDSPYDEAFTLPARLEAAGVNWCIASGEEAANERNLPYAAAMGVAFGLDQKAALEAITIRPAQILGIADKYGSIETGKSATLIVTDGNVLEVTTNVTKAFLDGRSIDLVDKQKALAEKYRERYRQLGPAGRAPVSGDQPATEPAKPEPEKPAAPEPKPSVSPAPAQSPTPAPTPTPTPADPVPDASRKPGKE